MPQISVPELPSRVSPLLTEQQAADLVGLKVATLRRWRWQGRALEFVKIGAAVRYELKVGDSQREPHVGAFRPAAVLGTRDACFLPEVALV
ncbi:hypothetical protein DF3PB_2360005 [uncultured Defluviicoccus sp.]|uniref:Helix-turn-helix domain-containing protein n=1 Tax=metagenome TaxID=256318 RepID=A0A380TED8_9ZZZZ|nr:hypothetical protein DF3PB_2360005 [uncultured Defluviicoccus sp.]